MPSIWTPAETTLIRDNLHLSTQQIYATYFAGEAENRSYDSVQKKVKAIREMGDSQDLLPAGYLPQIIQQADDQVLIDEMAEEELLVPTNEVEGKIALWLRDMANNYKGKKSTPVKSNGQSLVIVLSDNHFGKKTADFNLEVAKERVLSMTQSIIDAGGPVDKVDEVILALAGDEVEGEDIYSNQNGSLECPVIYQAKAACEAYWELALDLRQTFQCKVRIVTCPGNHGRMSKTADTRSNWDNVVYMMLGILIEQNPELDIEMDLNFDEFAMFEVKGKIGCAYHYGTKHLGTPAMTQKMAGWVMSKGIDFLVHGHWHHWGIETYLGRPMMHNGCMCGPDDLAEKMAVEEPPRQGYFYVERDKPIRNFGFAEW